MAEEHSIGAARIDIVVDTERMRADLKMAESVVRQLGDDYAAAFNKMSAAQKRVELEALRFAATQGKSRDEIRLMRLEAMGASEAVLKLAREQLAASRAVGAASQNINAATVNVKQLQQAIRFLPAQFTDIATSLAGGMNPLMVGLQQGGQILDQFRLAGVGAGGALRHMAGFLLGLINPATLSAAALGTLLYAWERGAREARAFNEALILTGHYAGLSAAQLADLAREMDEMDGVTRASASAALAAVAGTGQFAGEQLELVAKAAEQMRVATGRAIEETVREFERLRDDPVRAILDLNERGYNLNFLTQETYEQIKALKEQGREAEAAALAIRTYADVINDRAPKVVENLGWIEKAWRGVKDAVRETRDAILSIGREQTPGEQIEMLQGYLRNLEAGRGLYRDLSPAARERIAATFQGRIAELQRQMTPVRVQWAGIYAPVDSAAERARQEAEKEWERLRLSNLSKAEKLEREIQEIRKAGLAAGKTEAEIERQIAAARARYKESLPKGEGERAAESLIASIQRQITANRQLAETGEKVTASDRLLIQARQLLADKTGTMTAATRGLLEALLPQLEASARAAEATERQAKAAEALARQNAILAQQAQNRRYANELDLLAFGRGADAVAQLRRRLDIEREYAEEMKRLGDRSVADDKETWDRMAENARRHRDQQLAEEEEFQRQRVAAMLDWERGVRGAFEDYAEVAINQAGQVRDALTGAFSAAEDALVEFVKTGKLEFSDLTESILSDLARIGARMAAMNLLEASGLLGLFRTDGLTGFALGGAFDGGGVHAFAKGGVFTNSIVSKPTLFKFAKGIGLMGEAGPEAIMPLTRTASGRLGVAAVGAGGLQVQVNNYTGAKVAAREERVQMPDGQQLRKLVLDIVADDMAAGGRTASALRGRFGLREM